MKKINFIPAETSTYSHSQGLGKSTFFFRSFSSETYFTQLTIASEAQQEAGGFPTRLVSLQRELELCVHKVSWGFSHLCVVLDSSVGVGVSGFSAESFSYAPI